MSALTTRSFSLSLFLHTALIAALILWFAGSIPEIARPLPPLFTLMPNFTGAALTSAPPTVSVSIPVTRPTTPVDVSPAGSSTPSAALSSTKPALAPSRAPAPPKATTTLTIDEFRHRHGAPSSTPSSRPASTTRTVSRVSESFPISTSSVARPATAGASEDLSFTPGLLRDLRAAFVSTGISNTGLSAIVEFTFDEIGIFKAVRIARSSGDATFDTAVIAAFAQVRARGFPPEAAGQSYRVTFQTTGS